MQKNVYYKVGQTVFKKKLKIFNATRYELQNQQRGASLLEIMLVFSIVAALSPFFYSQIADISKSMQDVATAKKVITIRENALNFVRLNQDKWPDIAQIILSDAELDSISPMPELGLIDKYPVQDSYVTDIYLIFSFPDGATRSAQIAQKIGPDATIVSNDGVAYTASWAISSPDFLPGDLVYKINYDFNTQNIEKYLHKTASENEELNIMARPLNMNNFDLQNVGNLTATSSSFDEVTAAFLQATDLYASNIYFSKGANIESDEINIKSIRVNKDITGFNEVATKTLNKQGFSTDGGIIANRANIYNSVNVGNNLNLNPSGSLSVSGFAGIMAHYVETAYLATDELIFHNNFGITLSSELLMSTETPLKIGNWSFPSSTPPSFTDFGLGRTVIPQSIETTEFEKIMDSAWQDIPQKQ